MAFALRSPLGWIGSLDKRTVSAPGSPEPIPICGEGIGVIRRRVVSAPGPHRRNPKRLALHDTLGVYGPVAFKCLRINEMIPDRRSSGLKASHTGGLAGAC